MLYTGLISLVLYYAHVWREICLFHSRCFQILRYGYKECSECTPPPISSSSIEVESIGLVEQLSIVGNMDLSGR
jgi:hypothetical protein